MLDRLLATLASRRPVDDHFIFHMLPYKLLIWAGPIAHFGRPLFKSWLRINQQILHVRYQSENSHWSYHFD